MLGFWGFRVWGLGFRGFLLVQYPRKIKVNLLGLYRDYSRIVAPKKVKGYLLDY